MKKIIFILLLAASTGIVSAYDFQVDGLCYNILTGQTNAVEVTYEVYNDQANYAGLTTANIPDSVMYQDIAYSVTSIGNSAFYGCSGLSSITCEAVTPPTFGILAFNGVDNSIPLYVPANSIPLYRKANQWKDFRNIQAIPGTDNVALGNGKSDLLMESKPELEACIVFKDKILNTTYILQTTLLSRDFELGVRFENDTVCQSDYRIVSFDLVIYNRTYSSDSDKMTSEQGTAIKKLKVGASITISSIVAIGPDDKQYNLEPIKLIIH